jgi:hypothetical protein
LVEIQRTTGCASTAAPGGLGNGAVNSIDLLMLLVLHWGRKDCEPIDKKLIARLLPIQNLTPCWMSSAESFWRFKPFEPGKEQINQKGVEQPILYKLSSFSL